MRLVFLLFGSTSGGVPRSLFFFFFDLVVAGSSGGGGRLVFGPPFRLGALGAAGTAGTGGAEFCFIVAISPIPSKSISNSSKSMSLSSANISSKSKLSKAAASTDGAGGAPSSADELRLVRAMGGMIVIPVGLNLYSIVYEPLVTLVS